MKKMKIGIKKKIKGFRDWDKKKIGGLKIKKN